MDKKDSQNYSIAALCQFINVSRSCYYEWLDSPKTNRKKENNKLIETLKILFKKRRGSYGTRRLKNKLAKQGIVVSRRRIGQLMNQAGLWCKTKKKLKATTNSKHNKSTAPNLLNRQFTVIQPDRYYVGDITYVYTEEGWLYLAIVIDLFSTKIIGWSMDGRMKTQLVNDALLMAIWKRKSTKGLI